MARTEASSCVTTTKVAPSVSRSCRIRASSPAEVTGSSPAEGSSSSSSGGSSAKARAMPARLAMPPEISAGRSAAAAASPTCASFSRATAAQASGGRAVRLCNGSITFSSRLSEPNSAADWNSTPMLRRTASVWVATSCPNTRATPAEGGSRPITWRSRVDLPQPEPPRMANTSPTATEKLTSRKIVRPANSCARPSACTAAPLTRRSGRTRRRTRRPAGWRPRCHPPPPPSPRGPRHAGRRQRPSRRGSRQWPRQRRSTPP